MDVGTITNTMAFDSTQAQSSSGLAKANISAAQSIKKPEPTQEQKVTQEEVESVVSSLNKEIEPMGTNLSFGYSADINQLIVEVKDNLTGEVIRKLPSEEALHLAKKVKELVGIIFDKKA
jgi:flagellar protein FlaG